MLDDTTSKPKLQPTHDRPNDSPDDSDDSWPKPQSPLETAIEVARDCGRFLFKVLEIAIRF
jgi:hypothetical protein